MENQIQTSMLGRRVHSKDFRKEEEAVVVAAWLESVVEGRNYPYSDGRRVIRVYFLVEYADGSFCELKAIDTKAAERQYSGKEQS